MPSHSATPDQWRSEDKCRAVLETVSMSPAEFSEYCRKHGLYPEQVEQWKAACAAGNDRAEALEAEVRRKDKALSETAALLTLSNKAEAIWGHNDEDA